MKREYKHKITGSINIEKGKCYLYILYDPTFISTTFYVGKSNNPRDRLAQHFNEAKYDKDNERKNNWIKSIDARGIEVEMYIVCKVFLSMAWEEAEIALIAFLKWCGVELANTAPGGNGNNDLAGEKNGRALLNEKQVIEIIKMLIQDIPTKIICDQFGVKDYTIQGIRNGTTWKCVENKLDNEIRGKLFAIRNNKGPNGNIKTKKSTKSLTSWNAGMSMDEEYCNKISIAQKKRFETHTQWNTGLKMPEEYCKRKSELMMGDKNSFYGKKHTEANKRAQSIRFQGENGSTNKLTELQVIDILLSICDGIDITLIHKKYSFISLDTIRRIRKGRVWKYVIDLLDEEEKNILINIRSKNRII